MKSHPYLPYFLEFFKEGEEKERRVI